MPKHAEKTIKKIGDNDFLNRIFHMFANPKSITKIKKDEASKEKLSPIFENVKINENQRVIAVDRMSPITIGLIPPRIALTAGYLMSFFKRAEINKMITKEGSTTPIVLMTEPRIPACR